LAVEFNVFLENQNSEERKKIKNNYFRTRSSLEKNFNEFITKYNDSLTAFTSDDRKILK
jgi:hypothetical protein